MKARYRTCSLIISLSLIAAVASACGKQAPAGQTPQASPPPAVTPQPQPEPQKSAPSQPSDPKQAPQEAKPLLENNAFRLISPAPGTKAAAGMTVKGKARVFEASFSYSLEDGHNILAEGHVMAKQGAPEWGDFEFVIKELRKPTSPNGVLTLYEISAKDGSWVNELHIPVKFD
ncbi:Gmad2 immunoglobulin-like domain-containing protein [Paenibacillus sp. GD4]|uniref:Gmad2 immunoglobulin-like domain-containing protein n=1 Tax=Paenibacillus sp. GD4 TaxID=3068890 RepID=UPI00279675F7|nr:Gmad2 immunoglobulin-like domain-containing protein [Paenibacillus sp. GD4]MDQ1910426.1 Gmad2 immunoglobulin-like domain-containing protein [Paenibacillus sp. GD4]